MGLTLPSFSLQRLQSGRHGAPLSSTNQTDRIKHIQNDIEIAQGDLLDQMSIVDILREYKPGEVYNLSGAIVCPNVVEATGVNRASSPRWA